MTVGGWVEAMDVFLVEQSVEKEAKYKQEHGEKEAFYASELGKCDREIFYSFFPEIPTTPENARGLRILENGNGMHTRWGKYFEDMLALHGAEISLTTEDHDEFPFMLRGRLDLLVDDNVRNIYKAGGGKPEVEKMRATEGYAPDLRIVDMKSINPFGFKKVKETGAAKPEHEQQVQVYMHLTGIKKASLIYEDKATQDAIEIEVAYNKDVIFGSEDGSIEGIIPRLTRIAEAVEKVMEGDSSAIPERPPGSTPENCACRFSKYFDHCWNPVHQGRKVTGFAKVKLGEVEVDTDKLPEGITLDTLKALIESGALQVPGYTVAPTEPAKKPSEVIAARIAEEAEFDTFPDKLDTKFGIPIQPKQILEAVEQHDGKTKFVMCPYCEQRVNYARLGNGGQKKCDYCHEQIKVVRETVTA